MMKVVESISDIRLMNAQKKILLQPALKVEDTTPESYGTKRRRLRSLLLDILWGVRVKSTLYADRPIVNPATRYMSVQCYSNRRRSQGDLFLILRYYRPDVTFKEFRAVLFQLVNEKLVTTSYCSTINKRVFIKTESRRKAYLPTEDWRYSWMGIYGQNVKDEFGYTLKTATE